MYRIWLDTETSGLPGAGRDIQITEMAYIIEDIRTGEKVERVYDKIALRKDAYFSPMALTINRSDVWSNPTEGRITEYQASKKLEEICQKYTITIDGRKVAPIFTAYNGLKFDKPLVDKMLKRAGVSPKEIFNRQVCDPMVWAEELCRQGKLTTPMTNHKVPRHQYNLSAMANMYGVKSEGAHNAMVDIEMTFDVAPKIFETLTGRSSIDHNSNGVENFEEGRVYKVTSSTKSSGIKKREILILNNHAEERKLIVIDSRALDDAGGKFDPSIIRQFNYESILDGEELNEKKHILLVFYKTYKSGVDTEVNDNILKKLERPDDENFSDKEMVFVLDCELKLANGVQPEELKKDIIKSSKAKGFLISSDLASKMISFANKKCLIKGISTKVEVERFSRLSDEDIKDLNKELRKTAEVFKDGNPANPGIVEIYTTLRKLYPDKIEKVDFVKPVGSERFTKHEFKGEIDRSVVVEQGDISDVKKFLERTKSRDFVEDYQKNPSEHSIYHKGLGMKGLLFTVTGSNEHTTDDRVEAIRFLVIGDMGLVDVTDCLDDGFKYIQLKWAFRLLYQSSAKKAS